MISSKFDLDKSRELVIVTIAMHDLSLDVIDYEGFIGTYEVSPIVSVLPFHLDLRISQACIFNFAQVSADTHQISVTLDNFGESNEKHTETYKKFKKQREKEGKCSVHSFN